LAFRRRLFASGRGSVWPIVGIGQAAVLRLSVQKAGRCRQSDMRPTRSAACR